MPIRRWPPVTQGAALVAVCAWALVFSQDFGLFLPGFCAMTVLTPEATLASLDLALAINPPVKLAAGWGLMLAAMMTPLLIDPLRHIHDTSLPRRRAELVGLFLTAYAAVWMTAGAGLLTLALLLRLASPSLWVSLALALLPVLTWHASPARQRCLNRRHARPPLPAFGARAASAAIEFGADQGRWCVGACWGLMLLPLILPHGHLPAMAAIAVWQFGEHLEPPVKPAWGWRWPQRAALMALWRLRNLRPRPIASLAPKPLD